MASLTNAIRIFRHGGLSHEEFLAQIDRVLANDQTESTQLLEILTEEQTKFPLPADMYSEVQRRIERRGEGTQGQVSDETGLQTEQGGLVSNSVSGAASGVADSDRVKGVGDTLNGRFELKECLGVGGMGTVYKALDLRKLEASDRSPYIAIKVLNVQFRGHPKSLIALQREAKKAQTLAHPNIVTVYDFDRDGPMVYLTMEYLSGQPLNRLLRKPGFTGMPFGEAMRIVDGMAKALTYAHQRGFVHCDFKPANVFLTDSGEVKVIDFGIARVIQRPEEGCHGCGCDWPAG
jgi:predicted Ser/Thr protein kinase